MMSEEEANALALTFAFLTITVVLFTIPALVFRFAIKRQKLERGPSIWAAALTFLGAFTFIWLLAGEGEQVHPIIPAITAFAAWGICRYEKHRIW